MMTHMKKLTLGLSAIALTIGGAAYAQNSAAPANPPRMERPTADANKDGTLTRAEIQSHATAQFTRMDVNKDGKLDQADRTQRFQQMREAQFTKLDTDKNGSISKAEFMAERAPQAHRGPRSDRPAADAANGEGREARGWRGHRGGEARFGGHHGGPRGPMHRGMMAPGADANKDGAVTQAEFVSSALQRFDAQDTNKDGQITKEERQASREARNAERQAKRAAQPAAAVKAPAAK